MKTKEIKPEKEEKIEPTSHSNRCPDYDEDCNLVPNHTNCFFGKIFNHERIIDFGIAKGLCPYIHGDN